MKYEKNTHSLLDINLEKLILLLQLAVFDYATTRESTPCHSHTTPPTHNHNHPHPHPTNTHHATHTQDWLPWEIGGLYPGQYTRIEITFSTELVGSMV